MTQSTGYAQRRKTAVPQDPESQLLKTDITVCQNRVENNSDNQYRNGIFQVRTNSFLFLYDIQLLCIDHIVQVSFNSSGMGSTDNGHCFISWSIPDFLT